MTDENRRFPDVAMVCASLGAILIVLSFCWPLFDNGRHAWSDEQAQAMQGAAARYHELSFTVSPTSTPEEKQAFADAKVARALLEQQRVAAIDGAKLRKLGLRWMGLALALVGIAVYYRTK